MGPMGSGHSPLRHELCPWDDENSLPCKMMSKNNFDMTQLLCGHPAAKWVIQDFLLLHIWISLQQYCICLVSVLNFTHKSRPQCLRNTIMFERNPNVLGEKSLKTHFAAGCPRRSWVMSKIYFNIYWYCREISSSRGHSSCLDGLCLAPMGPIHKYKWLPFHPPGITFLFYMDNAISSIQ